MNKIIIKLIYGLSVLMLGVFLFSNNVVAVDTCRVSTAVTAIQMVGEKQYIIPLYIHNNKGIMGFRIDLNCDKQNIKIQSVTEGLVTAEGNFSSNVSLDKEKAITSILWNTTQNITENGTIMYIGIEVLEPDIERVDIEVNYSQPDTFNEQWEDVVLQCDSISFKPKQILGNNSTVGDNDMKELIENDDEAQYQDQAIQNLSKVKQNFVISETKLKSALVRTLKKYNAASISNISEEEEQQFWKDVEDNLRKYGKVKKSQLENVDLPRFAEMITIKKEDFEKEYAFEEQPEHRFNKVVYIAIAFILVLGFIVILYGKRRRKSEKE